MAHQKLNKIQLTTHANKNIMVLENAFDYNVSKCGNSTLI